MRPFFKKYYLGSFIKLGDSKALTGNDYMVSALSLYATRTPQACSLKNVVFIIRPVTEPGKIKQKQN